MFDNKNNISGELPEHIDFIHNKAIPKFREWGYDVQILRSEKDYLDLFYHVVTRSKKPERNGKYAGFLLAGMCAANSQLKIPPIKNFLKTVKKPFIQYIGIATDEQKRLKKLEGTNKISLLQRYGYTEKMAYDLCKKYDLLSPIYKFAKSGGCWFCPNCSYKEFARLKKCHTELWNKLMLLSNEQNIISSCFKYNKTFLQIDKKVDEINSQLSF